MKNQTSKQMSCRFSRDYYRRSQDALTVGLATAPVYRSWQRVDPGEGFPVDDRYAALTELTKKDIRENFPQGLVPYNRNVAEGLQRGEIEFVQTSGTTAERVTNIWHQPWWNASEAASWKLNKHTAHLDGNQPEAILASASSVGFRSEQELSMSARRLGRFLFLNEKVSAQEWTSKIYTRMVRELAEFKPVVLEANPSLLVRLAWWAKKNQVAVQLPEVIVFTYEFASAMHVRAMKQVFPVPMISSYGATEAGYIFMQCEHGTLHQNTEFCRVDFQPLKAEHGGPSLGRILVSTFHHPWMSLLRFDVGDLVRIADFNQCPCGRQEGFMLSGVEGRVANATFTTNGRLVTTKEIDDLLASIASIRDYQLEQNSRSVYSLKLVIQGDAQKETLTVREALRSLYGRDATLLVELCRDIEPVASGKYRRTRTCFTFDEKGLFA